MKRFISIMLTMCVGFLSFCAKAETINYYVIAKQAMPLQIISTENEHSGIVSDIVDKIFSGSHYHLNYHTYPFNRMISQLKAGGEDNWITYGSPAWGGVQASNLSRLAIYNVSHSLVTNKQSTFKFDTISSLKNKIFVLLHGFDYPELQPFIAAGTIHELRVKDYAAAFRILDKMPEDAVFVEMTSRIKYNLRKQARDIANYQLHDFSSVIPGYPIYLALDPNMDSDIQAFINQRLALLQESGSLSQIINRYI